MTRQIINLNQKQHTKTEYFNGRPINFNKDSGYLFSDHPAMDDCVNYFLSLEGFKLVSKAKKEITIQESIKKEKVVNTESKSFFSKKEKKNDSKKEG